MFHTKSLSSKLTPLTITFILLGCGHGNTPLTVTPTDKAPIAPTTTTPPTPPQEKTPTSHFAIQLTPQPKPNVYFVRVAWESNYNEKKIWFVNRKNGTTQNIESFPVTAGQKFFVDEIVQPNQSYTYSIGIMENSEFKEILRQTVKIPLDLHINTEINISNFRGYNRMFLGPQAILRTDNAVFDLDTNELYSEPGALIEPVSPNRLTPEGENGRDGSPIILKARKAVGTLTIKAHGANGGRGLKGSTGPQGAKGTKGADCNPKAPEGKQHAMGGEMGGPGYPGQQGYRGGTGGKNSPVQVEIMSGENFQLNLDQNPALGGAGGEAGNGGAGGPGGDPGNAPNHPSGMCHWKSAPMGPQGISGPNGQAGPAGPQGQTNSVCLKINSRIEGTCQ